MMVRRHRTTSSSAQSSIMRASHDLLYSSAFCMECRQRTLLFFSRLSNRQHCRRFLSAHPWDESGEEPWATRLCDQCPVMIVGINVTDSGRTNVRSEWLDQIAQSMRHMD